jgi:spoIIIJ-associated protein
MELALKEILTEIFQRLNVQVDNLVFQQEEDNVVLVDIQSPDSSLLIGRHGETILALQHLVRNLLWKKYPARPEVASGNFVLDINGYRVRQKESILSMVERKAVSVRSFQAPQILPPMSSYFRKLSHEDITKNFPDLRTESIGKGDQRAVKIFLA